MNNIFAVKFLEHLIVFALIQVLLCFAITEALNEINSNSETINIELNDENEVQYIQSPGFPNKPYPQNYSVKYNLKVNLSDRIEQLSARIRIKLEYIAIEPSDNCKDSNLLIIFPKGEMRVFCGVHAGKTMISDSGSVKIEFMGNALGVDKGFKIRTQLIRSKCSQKFTNLSQGLISSPNYPNNYNEEETCVWEVEVPEGKFVRVAFDEPFNINTSTNICSEDYLLVSRSGDFESDVQRFCGNERPDVIVSHSNKMLIKFNSDCCNTGKGFRATFIEHDRPEAAPERLPMLTPEDCPCGKENLRLVKRIVGGTEVNPPHRYPWMVSIVSSSGSLICGGVLINNYYVLTASHCAINESPDSIGVRIGQHDLKEPTPILKILKIKTHEQYDSVSQFNDIALIKLTNPVQFSRNIEPVCLPPSDVDEPDGLWVAGWGRIDQGGRTSSELREITLPEYPLAKCEEKFGGLITKNQLCAGGVEGQDACQGDSGGPMTSRIGGRVNVVGVVSWGIGCARKDYPGVYTRVTSYLKWIENNTKDSKYCLAINSNTNSSNQVINPPIQPNIADCGQPNLRLTKRVVGGTETAPQEFPWTVVIANNGQLIGSGSLISSNVVLTSALRLKQIRDSGQGTQNIKIIVGAHDVTKSEATKRVFQVQQIIFHPMFGYNTPYDYDFALIILKPTADGSLPNFRPVCLPRTDTPYNVGIDVIGAGWGRTSSNSAGSNTLRKVTLLLTNRRECSQTYDYSVTNSMICAVDYNKDMCLGDNGSPLMRYVEGRMYLFGVYSWQTSEGCGTGRPSVFSDVRYALQWIRDVTGNRIQTA